MLTSILTLNVWFSHYRQEDRFEFIIDEILRLSPDVVCLQEVTCDFLHLALRPAKKDQKIHQSQLIDVYDFSDTTGHAVNPYGCLILVKKRLEAKFSSISMPTLMNRSLIRAEIPKADAEVFTCHLESLNSESIRTQQLKVFSDFVKNEVKVQSPATDIFLMGDFNFCSYRSFESMQQRQPHQSESVLENRRLKEILPDFVDLWTHLNEAPGYTFDSEINKNIQKYEQMRYDRIMHFKAKLQCKSVDLCFNEMIQEAEVFSSDHFGLIARF